MLGPRLREDSKLEMESRVSKGLGRRKRKRGEAAANDAHQSPIRPHGAAVRLGEPVEGRHGQDGVEPDGVAVVAPLDEFLAHPANRQLIDSGARCEEQTHQASMAKGFVERTNEMVAGRVPCSFPYDVPFTLQAAALSTCTCSAGVMGMPATAAVCASVRKYRFTVPTHQHSPIPALSLTQHQEDKLTMERLAPVMMRTHNLRQKAPNITPLRHIPARGIPKPKLDHQRIHRRRRLVHAQLLLQLPGPGREPIVRDRRHHDMVRQRLGRVLGGQQLQQRRELEPGAGPAVEEDQRRGGGGLREEGREVDVEGLLFFLGGFGG